MNTENHILPVSRSHLRDRGNFIVLFQGTLDIAESRLCDSGMSPLQSSAVTAVLCNTALNGKEMGVIMQCQIRGRKKPHQGLSWRRTEVSQAKNVSLDIRCLLPQVRHPCWYLPTSAKIMNLTLLSTPQKVRFSFEGYIPHSAWTERKVHKGTAI